MQKGRLVSGAIVKDDTGIDLAYDAAGQRTYSLIAFIDVDQSWEEIGEDPETGAPTFGWMYFYFNNLKREDYTYDAAGRVASVKMVEGVNADTVPAAGPTRAEFTYDLMGRMLTQNDYNASGNSSSANVVFDRAITYNSKGQITNETSNTKRNGVTYRGETAIAYGTSGATSYSLGGANTVTTVNYENNVQKKTTLTTNTYAWWDSAVTATTTFDSDTSTTSNSINTSTYNYTNVGGAAQLNTVGIVDGRPRTITYRTDLNGQIIRRDEADNYSANGDPHEVWHRFGGKQMGYFGNNGTLETDYIASIENRTAYQGTIGAFRNNQTDMVQYADFDQSLDPINSYEQGTAAGTYIVREGDTLSSIAANVWGDASMWYAIAEANGITGNAALTEGQALTLPVGAMRSTHTSKTFSPYDPRETIGDTSPTAAAPPKRGGKNCGMLGTMLMLIVAIAVTIATHGATAPYFQATLGFTKTAAVIADAAVAGAAGSAASQTVGVATGVQSKFDWGQGCASLTRRSRLQSRQNEKPRKAEAGGRCGNRRGHHVPPVCKARAWKQEQQQRSGGADHCASAAGGHNARHAHIGHPLAPEPCAEVP